MTVSCVVPWCQVTEMCDWPPQPDADCTFRPAAVKVVAAGLQGVSLKINGKCYIFPHGIRFGVNAPLHLCLFTFGLKRAS